MLAGLRPPPSSGAPRRFRRPLVPVIVAAALVAVVAGIVIFRGHSDSTAASGTTPSTVSQDARRQAAVGLSGLLAQSVTDRAAVNEAAVDLRGCGPSLRQDARTLARAASSRQRLLSRLGSLPGRSLLPAAMLQDLTSAWQASAQVDTDLAGWADAPGLLLGQVPAQRRKVAGGRGQPKVAIFEAVGMGKQVGQGDRLGVGAREPLVEWMHDQAAEVGRTSPAQDA